MKISIELPEELDWVREELEQSLARGQGEMAAGARPEYAAGYYAAAKDITENLESRFLQLLEQRRGKVREIKRG